MAKFFFSRQAKYALWLLLLLPTVRIFSQPVVVDFGTTNIFTADAAATNFLWTLDGVSVGGNSNSFAYTPQVYDVGTHYLLVNQTFPGAVNSNSYWDVRVRIALPASGGNYYVATNGSDSNAGTLAAPFLTLEKARNTIRALARPLPAGGVTVWLRGGTFYRTNSLMLTNANDSGTATAPVVWRSYSNETAVISGGTSIPAAGWVPLNSSQTNRVAPGVNPTNIWELDLASAGITHATNFPADFNQWTTFNTYNQGVDGGLCELIYNGQRQFLSRYPNHNLTNDDLLTTNMLMDGVANGLVNAGTTLIYSGDSTNSLNYPGTYTNSSGQAIPVGGAFMCKTNDVARFTRWQTAITNGGLWLQGYWRVSWQIDGVNVIGFDVTNRTVMLNTNAHPGNGIGNKYNRPVGSKVEPYWALNLLEEMDQPGEWAVDFNRKKIYFYAPGPLTDGSVVISDFGSPLVQIGGAAGVVSNVVFQSVNFEAALAQTILITNAMNNLVLGCNFNNINNYAVDINGGGTNGVVSCNLQNLAAGGVLLRGGTANFNQTLRVPARDFVVNNVITNFARVVRVYAAAVDAGFGGAGGSGGGGGDTTCVGMRIAHNNMSVSPHGVVLFGSWDTTHEYNELSHYQQVSDDLGGFYSDDLISRHGNQVFRYNFMHDTPLGNGIDYDGDHYLMQHYGNIINLNTIPSESQGIGIRYQTASQATSGNEQSAVCYNNLIANGHLGASFVALLPSVIEENAATFCTTPFSWQQVVGGATNNTIVTVSQSAMQSGPNTNYVADPGFLSLTNNDMRLNPASRVYSDMPNFQQIPVEMIGLYNDEFRTNAAGWSPFITTSNAVNVTPTNAVCDGKLFFPQFDSNTTVMVYYGLTDGGSNALAWQSSTNIGIFPAGNLSAQVGGLQPNTNYYFRFFATNAFGYSWSANSSSLVTPPPPPFTTFTNLTPNQTVLANAFVSLGGQVFNTTPLYPTNGEIISVTINGVTQTTYTTNNNGSFSIVFNATNIPVATGGYAITYAYAGSTNLSGTTNTSTALSIVPSSFAWSGATGTNFETGGSGGNWSDYAAPINDLVSCTAIFGNPPTANLPALTTNRNIWGLSFSATNGGWKLSGGSNNFVLGVGGNGITTAGQTNGTNYIAANLNVGANQTWQSGAGGTILFTGSITNSALNTNYSLTFNSGSNTGTVILSPSASNKIFLIGSNNTASIFQVKSGGVLQLGGDGVNAPTTASTNQIFNTSTNTFGAFAINAPGKVKVNSGYWIFTDLGKNGSDKLTGTLEVDGGTVSFGGGRYLGEGTIQVNGGALKFGSDAMTHYINGGRFSLGNFYTVQTNVAVMNITGGFVDLAQANGSVGNGNGIGYGLSTLLNQSGGVLQNGVTPGTDGTTTSFSIGGLNGSGNGTTNNLSAFTLTGGMFISAGVVAASTNAGPGSVNNFNFMGGVLAVQSFNATNLGSSPTATAFANQTNVSLALGTLANYGGVLAPGNLGVPGETVILGNYAVSNNAAVLAIDLGGTNQANAFQNGNTNYDFVSVAGNTTLGGSLSVNLINNFSPAATNSFTIFTTGGTLGGVFTNVIGGRVAVTNITGGSFAVVTNSKSVVLTNFTIVIAPSTPPVLSGVFLSGTNLIFTGTNGTAGENYLVLTATNLALPITNWTVLATNQFGSGGAVNFTNPLDANSPQNFFRLRLP
jgi:hypothetical protein